MEGEGYLPHFAPIYVVMAGSQRSIELPPLIPLLAGGKVNVKLPWYLADEKGDYYRSLPACGEGWGGVPYRSVLARSLNITLSHSQSTPLSPPASGGKG